MMRRNFYARHIAFNSSGRRPALALLAFALLLFVGIAPARADGTDDLVEARMRERHIPGLALAVVHNGQVMKAKGYGVASVEFGVPVTPDTVFEIGSVTKQITAAAVMLLVEDGKLALDDPVTKHLAGLPAAWRPITIRHLLTHTAGVKNYTGLPGFELSKRMKRADFIKMIANLPLNFTPGDSWSYGNTAYNLLGHIIEVASGVSYWEFVTTRIFRPLGMTATGDRDPKRVVPQRANGYEWEMNALTGRDYDLTDVFSAGAVVSTLNDLIKWDAALSSDKLLKGTSRDALWTPVRLNDGKTRPYGLGWYVETLRGHRVRRHNGQTAGFAAAIARYVDDGVSVIVLSNIGDIGIGGDIARSVAKIYIPSLSLQELKAQTDDDATATEKHEALLRARLSGSPPDATLLTPAMRSSLDTEVARRTARRLASYGALQSFAFVENDNTNGERARRYKSVFDGRIVLWRFNTSDDGKIAGMILEEEEER